MKRLFALLALSFSVLPNAFAGERIQFDLTALTVVGDFPKADIQRITVEGELKPTSLPNGSSLYEFNERVNFVRPDTKEAVPLYLYFLVMHFPHEDDGREETYTLDAHFSLLPDMAGWSTGVSFLKLKDLASFQNLQFDPRHDRVKGKNGARVKMGRNLSIENFRVLD